MQDTNPAPCQASFIEITGEPNLPDVLLIGDSISMGYTIPTRERLRGKANVHRPSENCGPTSRGLERLDEWLGDRRWDVIHFNWGLHDLKYADGEGRHLTSVDQYKENLGKLISRLKTTGAKLIWATTTPVPAGANGRKQGDAATYNAAAKEIMNQPGITINDLYTFALPRLKEIQLPQNVHFTKEGSGRLADQVARSILERLSE
ncbi:MAG: SGNH/GDSL hydrolase family protein [Gemmatimonadota bacterium]|nr:SGNH/GDSL hydrolase family protein [Gemmatimonadota bacterium]